jgi:hypothetical protein
MGGKKRQIEFIVTSYLPRRTVQVVVVIDNLNSEGLMTERNSLDDVRKKGILAADSAGLAVIS